MNTRKLFFGFLACLTFLAVSAAPYITAEEEPGIEKKILKPRK